MYTETREFPKEEVYGLTSQIRRSALSIPSNIAEGCGREGDAELARITQIAMGSASELEYQIQLSRDLGYMKVEQFQHLMESTTEVKRMLAGFLQTLRKRS